MALVLDHIFCLVDDPVQAAGRIEAAAGRPLDAGTAHRGQGTRNRRLPFAEHYLELLWIEDPAEAARNPLRLDRRTSPFGIGLRGALPAELRDHYWRYDALGFPIRVRRDDGDAPLVFVLELPEGEAGRRAHADAPALERVRLRGPQPAALPPHAGPPIEQAPGPPTLELVAGGVSLAVSPRPGGGRSPRGRGTSRGAGPGRPSG